jgi:MYXO-CTERM domain-containing protein
VVVATRDGWLFAWKTPGKSDGVVQWESFRHDNRNTGNYETPLEQGKRSLGGGPLPVDAEGKCIPMSEGPEKIPVEAEPHGGCACRLGPSPVSSRWAWLGLLPLAGGWVRRRRR